MLSRSFQANSPALKRLFTFKASELVINKHPDHNKPVEFPSPIPFGQIPSRHMMVVDYVDGKWEAPVIKPFENFEISPMNMTFHYALCCFEGMKAYKDANGDIRMFRPDENMKRMNTSVDRLGLQGFEGPELLGCLEELLRLDHQFIPTTPDSSIYIRPFSIALDNRLSVGPSQDSRICVVLTPVGPYFGDSINPISLAACRDYERGNPRSAAAFKLGGNYAPTVTLSQQYAERGFAQILWVHDDKIIEVGACNIFFLLKNKDGSRTAVTPPLDGSVLPGITRKSIIQLIKEQGEVEVEERDFTVTELKEAFEEGRVDEIFGAGTAATCIPVGSLEIDGKIYETGAKGDEGWDFTKKMLNTLNDIYYGRMEHEFSHLVRL